MDIRSVDGKIFNTHEGAKAHNNSIRVKTRLGEFKYGQYIEDKRTNRIRRVNSDGTLTEVRPIHKRINYIGGTSNEARQKYFNIDQEYSDSVRSISKRYGIDPNVVASRLAKEGPIDGYIRTYNRKGRNKNLVASEYQPAVWGPESGLDDIYTDIQNGNVKLTTTAPYSYYELGFTNEKGRNTHSIYSPQWWMEIEGTAAELKYRRDEMKKAFPGQSKDFYDAAAAAAFNRGITGAKKFINNGGRIYKYSPFITVQKPNSDINYKKSLEDTKGKMSK